MYTNYDLAPLWNFLLLAGLFYLVLLAACWSASRWYISLCMKSDQEEWNETDVGQCLFGAFPQPPEKVLRFRQNLEEEIALRLPRKIREHPKYAYLALGFGTLHMLIFLSLRSKQRVRSLLMFVVLPLTLLVGVALRVGWYKLVRKKPSGGW